MNLNLSLSILAVIWFVIAQIDQVHSKHKEWWSTFIGNDFDSKYFLQPAESSQDIARSVQLAPPPWEPMIKPEFNKLIGTTFSSPLLPSTTATSDTNSASQLPSQSQPNQSYNTRNNPSQLLASDSAEFRGESSQENVRKRWPSNSDLERNLFKSTWQDGGETPKSTLIALNSKEPDWSSEDPFRRFERNQPQLGPPIYHRDVEEIRSERRLPEGYDKSVSRLSEISWDDKEEYTNGNDENVNKNGISSEANDLPSSIDDGFDHDNSNIRRDKSGEDESFNSSPVSPLNDSNSNRSTRDAALRDKLKSSAIQMFRKMVESGQLAPVSIQRVRTRISKPVPKSRSLIDPPNDGFDDQPDRPISLSVTQSPPIFGTRLSNTDRPKAVTTESVDLIQTTPQPLTTRVPFWHTFSPLTSPEMDRNGDEISDEPVNTTPTLPDFNDNKNNNNDNDDDDGKSWDNFSENDERKRKSTSIDLDLDNVVSPITSTQSPLVDTVGDAIEAHINSFNLASNRSSRSRRRPNSSSKVSSPMFSYETNIDHTAKQVKPSNEMELKLRKNVALPRVRKQIGKRKRKIKTTPAPSAELNEANFDSSNGPSSTNAPQNEPPSPPSSPSSSSSITESLSTTLDVSTSRPRNVRKSLPILEKEETSASEGRLEDSIRGSPGQDYGTYTEVPKTSFKCSDQQYPGYYGDEEAQCQVFHICQTGGRQDDFICPIGTVFNQQLLVCDWWYNFRCDETRNFYSRNAEVFEEMNARSGSTGSTVVTSSQPNSPANRRSIATKEEAISDDDNEEDANLPNGSRVYFDEDVKEDKNEDNQEESSLKSSSSSPAGKKVKLPIGPSPFSSSSLLSSTLKDVRTTKRKSKKQFNDAQRRGTIREVNKSEFYFNDDKSLSKLSNLEEDL